MMKQLRANSERVNRSVARPASAGNALRGNAPSGNAMFNGTPLFGTDATTIAWTVKPVHTTAICTNGKYHTRRLQEMLT